MNSPSYPGEEFMFSLQARELGTSKLMGLITIYDEKGKRLASAGDGPLPLDVGAVQVSSRTQGDPDLQFKVPKDVTVDHRCRGPRCSVAAAITPTA